MTSESVVTGNPPGGSAAVAESCLGCGGRFAACDGPTHRYMRSSAACWRHFGRVLAREYSEPAWMAAHRLTVDAYAVQHPGDPSPQTAQSVAIHLMSLHAVLDRGLTHAAARDLIVQSSGQRRYDWLDPPAERGTVTVADVSLDADAAAHLAQVERWAASAWSAWRVHHAQIEAWAREVRRAY